MRQVKLVITKGIPMATYTIMVQEDYKTVYEQVVETDRGIVRVVANTVNSYKPKQVRDLDQLRAITLASQPRGKL